MLNTQVTDSVIALSDHRYLDTSMNNIFNAPYISNKVLIDKPVHVPCIFFNNI